MPELLQEMYYGPNVQNLIESDDCKVMRLSDNSGEGMMTLYHVFPGVFLKELLQQEGTYKKFIQIREQAEGWRIQ